MHMHATVAVTATGLPLGVLALGFDPVKTRSKHEEKHRKTQRWLEAFNGTADAAREIGRRTRVLCVCDRVLYPALFRRRFLGLFLIERGSICHIDSSSSES